MFGTSQILWSATGLLSWLCGFLFKQLSLEPHVSYEPFAVIVDRLCLFWLKGEEEIKGLGERCKSAVGKEEEQREKKKNLMERRSYSIRKRLKMIKKKNRKKRTIKKKEKLKWRGKKIGKEEKNK